jgi:hypothetical protein
MGLGHRLRSGYKSIMADLLFIGMMVAFFGLAVGLIRICDRIIGTDEGVVIGAAEYDDNPEEMAA